MESLKTGFTRVVDEHELANLIPVDIWPKAKMNQTHVGEEPYTETICIKQEVVVGTHVHKQTIARFMSGMSFGLRRDPTAILEFGPLYLTLATGKGSTLRLFPQTTAGSESIIMWQCWRAGLLSSPQITQRATPRNLSR